MTHTVETCCKLEEYCNKSVRCEDSTVLQFIQPTCSSLQAYICSANLHICCVYGTRKLVILFGSPPLLVILRHRHKASSLSSSSSLLIISPALRLDPLIVIYFFGLLTKTLQASSISAVDRSSTARPILLDLVTLSLHTILRSSSLCNFLQFPDISSLLGKEYSQRLVIFSLGGNFGPHAQPPGKGHPLSPVRDCLLSTTSTCTGRFLHA